MNILVTGGAGFIGSHLVKHFYNTGNNVFVVDNLITGAERNLNGLELDRLTFYRADIQIFDYEILPQIDLCFNMASPASPIQYKKHPVETLMTNAQGTYRLMEAMKNGKIKRLVQASTSEIYGDPLEHPQKESYWGNVNTLGPRACYDEAKRFAEALVSTYHRSFEVDARIARIFNTYGPNMEVNDGRVVSNFITQSIAEEPITIYGDGTQTRSFCYVSDLVKGLIALGEKEGIEGDVINLGNPNERSMTDLAQMIQKMTQTKSEIVYHPIDDDDPKRRKPDISKAKKLLGWEPTVEIEEGLNKTIEYFKTVSS